MVRINRFSYLILIFLSVSCGRFAEITVGEFNGVTIKGFEENSLLVTLHVPIENPTFHRIVIKDFDTRLFMNTQYVGKISSEDVIVLPARSDQVYEINVRVRVANFIGTAISLMSLKKGQKVNFRLEGTVSARTALIRKTIAINEAREVII